MENEAEEASIHEGREDAGAINSRPDLRTPSRQGA
jgi:hypothetical protein